MAYTDIKINLLSQNINNKRHLLNHFIDFIRKIISGKLKKVKDGTPAPSWFSSIDMYLIISDLPCYYHFG
jgi:hypothetical protein